MKPVLHYYDMGEGVVAFSTTRHGGVSSGNHAELNLNPYCGDAPAAVAANRDAVAAALGLSARRLVMPHQAHGARACLVDGALLALDDGGRRARLEGVDALVTREPRVCIGVSTADCIPVLLYDCVRQAIAAIHAGWRGTVSRIAGKTFEEMRRAFGTHPEDTLAVIGPGISQRHFEVGQEVYDLFSQSGFDMGRIARHDAKWHIDLPLCNQLQLEDVGIPTVNIRQTGICTFDAVADYFSARRMGVASGRIYTGILLV